MVKLYDYLASNEDTPRLQGSIEYKATEPYHDEAVAVDMLTPALETAFGLKGLSSGYNAFKGVRPFLGDIWEGRKLIFHKPFKWMSRDEFNNYGKLGKKYYQNFLQRNPINIEGYGEIKFSRPNKGKDDTVNMEQYPFLRYKLNNAKKIDRTNTKNEIDREYDILENRYKGNLYNYLIEDIIDVGKRYKMIKKK